MFSRQHYEQFAKAMKSLSPKEATAIAKVIVPIFKNDNPRFELEKFLFAAGINNEETRKLFSENQKNAMKETVISEMKLVTLLPAGRITTLRHGGSANPINELSFHGGNPTPEDVAALADDFDDAFDEAEESLDTVLFGIIDNAHEAEFKEIESAISQQVKLLRKAMGAFRANVQKIYDAQKKKLGGK